MKKFIAYTMLFLIMACSGDENSSATANMSSDVLNPSISVSIADRKTRTIALKWNPQDVPRKWQSYSLCEKNTREKNNCKLLKEGSTTQSAIALKLGEDNITLDLLLANKLIVFFHSEDEISEPFVVDIASKLVHQTVQYVKAGQRGSFQFGMSAAISSDGKTLAISSGEDVLSASKELVERAGAVYVFTDTEEKGWQQTARLTSSRLIANGYFGINIAISDKGDTLAAALPFSNAESQKTVDKISNKPIESVGAVVVFSKGAQQTWTEQAYLQFDSAFPALLLGNQDIAISGDGKTLAATTTRAPFIVVFEKTSSEKWDKIISVGNKELGRDNANSLSLSLNFDGSVLAAGFPNNASSVPTEPAADEDLYRSGGVFIFTGNDFADSVFFKPKDTEVNDNFGLDVNLSGDAKVLAVSARLGNGVFIYDNKGNSWPLRYEINEPADEQKLKDLGSHIWLSKDGKRLAMRAGKSALRPGINTPIEDNAKLTNHKAVVIYSLNDTAPSKPSYILQSLYSHSEDLFGYAMALSEKMGTLVLTSVSEASNAIGLNGDETNDDAPYSGAAWIYQFDAEEKEKN